MSKFVVVVFDNEKAAYEGSRAMLALDAEGSIALYAGAVVSKSAKGEVRVEDGIDDGPIGTAAGALLGGLIGAIGGPQMMVAGALGGATGGWLSDIYNVGVDGQFLQDVGAVLTPGKYAVVAEANEAWTTPLDTRMEELGGTVFRRDRIDVEDAQIERDIEATNRELEELDTEFDQAVGEAKDKIKAKADAARAKLQSLQERASQKAQSLKDESEAKINKLEEQISKASGDAKAKFQQHRDQLKSEYAERSAKLKKAAQLTADALS